MKKILLVRFSSFGDIVLALAAASEYFSNEKVLVHVLTKEPFKPLVEQILPHACVHAIPKHATIYELWKKIGELNKNKYDLVLDLHRNLRSTVVYFFIKAIKKVRIQKYRLKELFLFCFRRDVFNRIFESSTLSRKRELQRTFKIAFEEMGFFPNGNTRSEAKPIDRNAICISSDSLWSSKRWSKSRFEQLAVRIYERFQVRPVWVGFDFPTQNLNPSMVSNEAGEKTISQLVNILSTSRLLICNDSGLMHLAEFLGTPAIAIFGPTSAEVGFAPSLLQSRIVASKIWCRPCSKSGKFCFRLINRRKCLDDVSVDQVFDEVVKFLKPIGFDQK